MADPPDALAFAKPFLILVAVGGFRWEGYPGGTRGLLLPAV